MKLLTLGLGLFLALAIACGGDDDDSSAGTQPTEGNGGGSATQASGSEGAAPTEAPSSSGGSAPSGGGGGSLTIGDEVIELASARCFLQEQDVTGSPGKILFQAQGYGMTAEGEELVLDVTRFDEDSLFTGDDIEADIGDPFGEDFYYWSASADIGTVEIDGSTLRVGELTFRHSEDGSEVTGTFELNC